MTIHELRRILYSQPKYPGVKTQQRSSMCNPGYPGNFNLSLSNAEHLQEYGQFLDYTHSTYFSKIGQMIRLNDWNELHPSTHWRYLSLFHMADISGVIMSHQGQSMQKRYNQFLTQQFVSFWKRMGLDLAKLRITYLPGGQVSQITDGKYDFEYFVPPDPITEDWIDAGLSEHNLVPDVSRNTLLSLNNFDYRTPWGYRNEIHYEYRGELLDIATLEHFCYRPIFNRENKIIHLTSWDNYFGTTAVGVERLLMVLNGHNTIHDIHIIAPLLDVIRLNIPGITINDTIKINEGLRMLAAILGDVGSYSNLSRNRKAKLRSVIRGIADILLGHDLDMSYEFLMEYLTLNADL